MMNMKKTYIILGTTILSISAFTGCNTTDNSSLVSVFSDSIMEIEIPEPADSLNRGNESSENKIDADGSAIGTDGKTNEELEEELNDHTIDDYKPDASGALDDNHDGRGFNLTTGEYEPAFDTNNGQGFDRNGKHYNTKGEYIKAFHETTMSNPDFLTDEELETLVNGGTITN